jgi:hypothetical protein
MVGAIDVVQIKMVDAYEKMVLQPFLQVLGLIFNQSAYGEKILLGNLSLLAAHF